MRIIFFILLALFITSCISTEKKEKIMYPSHQYLYTKTTIDDVEKSGRFYVPVYSDIYHIDGSRRFQLTATLSIRNVSTEDEMFVFSAAYYDSAGELLRDYVDQTILLAPLESIEFVIENKDHMGGAGAKFIVQWGSDKNVQAPLISAVMIGTSSQQGISFISNGVPLE